MAKRGTKEWRQNIGMARSLVRIWFSCEKCGTRASDRPSHYRRKRRHFCSTKCYADFRRDDLPIEEHNRYGTGNSPVEKERRKKARSILNHYLRDKKVPRQPCEKCKKKAEAHHDDYSKPLEVRWLCFKHHRQHHKENLDLLN